MLQHANRAEQTFDILDDDMVWWNGKSRLYKRLPEKGFLFWAFCLCHNHAQEFSELIVFAQTHALKLRRRRDGNYSHLLFGRRPVSLCPNQDIFVLICFLTSNCWPLFRTRKMGCCCSTVIDFNGEVSLFHFELHRTVGKGAFGKVCLLSPSSSMCLCPRYESLSTDARINFTPLNTSISRNVSDERLLPISYRSVDS